MLGDAPQVAALEAVERRRSVPGLQRTGLLDAVAAGVAIGKDLVEDRVRDPGGGIFKARVPGCGQIALAVFMSAYWTDTRPV